MTLILLRIHAKEKHVSSARPGDFSTIVENVKIPHDKHFPRPPHEF